MKKNFFPPQDYQNIEERSWKIKENLVPICEKEKIAKQKDKLTVKNQVNQKIFFNLSKMC